MRNWLTAWLTAVLVAVVWVSPPSVAYLCSMDGQRRATCCCTPDGDHAERRQGRVERRDCCQVEHAATHTPATVAPSTDEGAPHIAALSWSEMDGVPAATAVVPMLARGPPLAIGPPPYLRHCRFLI